MVGAEGISVADALALRNSGNNGNNDAWGGNGAWWIILLVILFAWNRGGWGGNNDGNSGYNACCTPATAQGVADAFNFNQLDNGVRAIQNGLCDGFYAMQNSTNAVGSSLKECCCQTQQAISNLGYQTMLGLNGVDKSIIQNGYANQAGFTSLGNQLASCCCDIERGQDAIKYEMSQLANSLLVAGDKNTDRIINHLTQTEMERLRTDLLAAKTELSQINQTNDIVGQLMPVAKPAYITCSPYASSFGIGVNGYGYNGYGCGCSCA